MNSETESTNTSSGVAATAGKSSDNYNGNSTDRYSWSQTIHDLDVKIPILSHIRKGKDLSVSIKTDSFKVRLAAQPEAHSIISGEFTYPVNKDDCYWSLIPGETVSLFLQKSKDRWWTALLKTGEEPINPMSIEAVIPMHDLQQEEQMKVQELMWKQEQKEKMIPVTPDEKNLESILKKAWDAEGSPFKGMPYDPGMVKMGSDKIPEDVLRAAVEASENDESSQ